MTLFNRFLTLFMAFLVFLFCGLPKATAQVQANQPFPDQFVGATLQYDQASSTPFTGGVFYGKLADKNLGAYSYTLIRETAITRKPTYNVQTQTETGFCIYTTKFGTFDVFSCGTGGIATAGGSTGVSGSGQLLITKALKQGWTVGIVGGPSYSGIQSKVTYPVGLVIGWGR